VIQKRQIQLYQNIVNEYKRSSQQNICHTEWLSDKLSRLQEENNSSINNNEQINSINEEGKKVLLLTLKFLATLNEN
jgi:hypothetical protein